MARPDLALTAISTETLSNLLRYLHRGELECPVTPLGFTCVGLQDRSEVLMATFRGLDEAGVRAVLVAVLAERGVGRGAAAGGA